MSREPHDEPVFIRSRGHYYYNRRNPVGRFLIVASLLVSGWILYDYYDSVYWTEGELRDAVQAAAEDLQAEEKRETLLSSFGYDSLIRDAVNAADGGPGHGADVRTVGEEGAGDGPGPDRFEVSTDDTETVYCMSVSPPRPKYTLGLDSPVRTIRLSVTFDVGRC
ncbi:hypothetical protein ACFUJR_21485 [Streptomyces sp. NPDC057271]|uniref:hypothetical protein n=1 Tax=unclassified Streptomyces TaxID=2593676 RepID=UPI003635AA99